MAKDRKETLLRMGERLFALHGYRDVSIKEITENAGLGTGSFYSYFPSKESFYSSILDRLEQRGIQEVQKHVSSFQSPLNKLKALYRFATLALQRNGTSTPVWRRTRFREAVFSRTLRT